MPKATSPTETKNTNFDGNTVVGVIPVKRFQGFIAVIALAVLLSGFFALSYLENAYAVTTVPTKMNFQGRLTDSNGNIKADGLYNMKLRLFTVDSGGTDVWNETRETTNRVQVTNGLFSIRLGDVTPIPAGLFASGSLYLEVELPTPASATCSTASCASFTEGAMTPRSLLSTSAYAYNAETLDGLDSAALAQLGASNTFTADNLVKTTSTTAFRIQDGTGAELLSADTSGNMVVKIGNPGTSTLSNVRLMTSNAEFTTTVRVGNATNGVEFSATAEPLFRGSARPTRTITLAPEFAGATFRGDGSDNNGSLSSDFCSASAWLNINTTACANSGEEHNFYEWTTTQGTAQDYDLYVHYQIPSDYDTGSMTNLTHAAQGTNSSQESTLTMYKDGTQCSTTGDVVTSTGWLTGTVASPLGSCTIAAGNKVVFKIHVSATQNQTVRAGEITFTYRSKF